MRPLAAAFDLVDPFVSADETRPHLCRPARYTSHVVATDGHTMGVARYDGDGSDPGRELNTRATPPPPWDAVIPRTLVCIGELSRDMVEPFRHYPAKWFVAAEFAPDGALYVAANVRARTGRHGKVLAPSVTVVPRVALDCAALRPKAPFAVAGEYLVRCFDAATMGVMPSCYVMNAGPLDPIVFAPDAPKDHEGLKALPHFAIAMPMRI